EHMVYEAELVGLSMGLEIILREEGVKTAAVYMDNQAAIKTMQAASDVGPGQHLKRVVERAHRDILEKHRGINISTIWVPGHEGIAENE
ncbi:hypothetical protein K439DRAFT_1295061, partial [Ramaria rubella]